MQPQKEETKPVTGFAYIRRLEDGVVLDIPMRHLQKAMKRKHSNGSPMFEYVGEVQVSTEKVDVPIIEEGQPPVVDTQKWNCPLCGKEMANEAELKTHKEEYH